MFDVLVLDFQEILRTFLHELERVLEVFERNHFHPKQRKGGKRRFLMQISFFVVATTMCKQRESQPSYLKNFIPMRREMMHCLVWVEASLLRNSRNSEKNFLLMLRNLDWARTPRTSAYKSAIMWMLVALGPSVPLKGIQKKFRQTV